MSHISGLHQAFLLRSMARTLLGTVYYCTCAHYSSLWTLKQMVSCLYCIVQLTGASLASTEVWKLSLFWPMRDQHMNRINQSSYCHIDRNIDETCILTFSRDPVLFQNGNCKIYYYCDAMFLILDQFSLFLLIPIIIFSFFDTSLCICVKRNNSNRGIHYFAWKKGC